MRRAPHKESGGVLYRPRGPPADPLSFPQNLVPNTTKLQLIPPSQASRLPEASSTAAQTADIRSGKWRRWGEGKPGNVPSQNRPTTKPPQPPPSSGETGLRPSPPRAVRPAPFLTGQGYRPYAAEPPHPLTARQRTSVGPHHPPRALLPRRRARLAALATAVARGRSDWPKAASIKALEEATAPPPAGASLQAVRPLRAREKPDLEKVSAAFREAKPLPEPIILKPQ